MNKLLKINIIIILSLSLFSCSQNGNKLKKSDNTTIKELTPKYAKYFKISYFKDKKVVTVFNPWKNNEIYQKYIISNNDSAQNDANAKYYINAKKLNKIAVLSGTQIAMFDELKLLNKIKAVENKKIVYNKKITNNSNIIEIGGFNLFNYEMCINKGIEAIFTTGWDKLNDNFKKINEAGIPVIYSLDWQETSPLGRAEWIKFVACFFNKEKLADSIFASIEQSYLKNKHIADTVNYKPKVINGNVYNGTWYVAGGESYVAHFFEDAGADYIFKNNNKTGSIPLSFETVFLKSSNADFWITSTSMNNQDIIPDKKLFEKFKPYKNHNIYVNTKRINTSTGANDYWESAVLHPEYVLQDFIKIFHPELMKNYQLKYYKKYE